MLAVDPVVAPGGGVAFVEGAEVAELVGAGFVPAHAGAIEAFPDDIFAGGFDGTGADFPAVCEVSRIVGAVQVVAEIVGQHAVPFDHRRRGGAEIEGCEFFQQGSPAAVFEFVTPGFQLRFAYCGVGGEYDSAL